MGALFSQRQRPRTNLKPTTRIWQVFSPGFLILRNRWRDGLKKKKRKKVLDRILGSAKIRNNISHCGTPLWRFRTHRNRAISFGRLRIRKPGTQEKTVTRTARPSNLVQAIKDKEARNPGENCDANCKTEQSRSGD